VNDPRYHSGTAAPQAVSGSPLFNAALIRKLGRWECSSGHARSLVVHVLSDVGIGGGAVFPPSITGDEVYGLGGNPTIQPQGIGLRLVYGAGAASKEVWCDLISGSIQLPPCSFAQVDLFQTVTTTSQISASIVEGRLEQAPVPTVTQTHVFAGPDTLTVYPPRFARAVDIWADASSVGAALKLRYRPDIGAQVLLENDYSSGLVFPPSRPVMLGANSEAVLEATAACSASVRYFLGL
jgi:hypothetical protein